MALHNRLGIEGEELACRMLQEKGYVILERNWVYRNKEIDIICQDHRMLVFVEVKTRTANTPFSTYMAVDEQKIWNIVYAANAYIKLRKLRMKVRYDVVAAVFDQGEWSLKHMKSAFCPPIMKDTFRRNRPYNRGGFRIKNQSKKRKL
ncbi:YraN family protein [Falsiporphyromonas endometrii]|uniref:UPF0102 protein ACFO3G_09365 n=1 Tax=Falsiporphyromonas endometrii TaxID=1387297 RepID=A0ABV9K9T3_9PORP